MQAMLCYLVFIVNNTFCADLHTWVRVCLGVWRSSGSAPAEPAPWNRRRLVLNSSSELTVRLASLACGPDDDGARAALEVGGAMLFSGSWPLEGVDTSLRIKCIQNLTRDSRIAFVRPAPKECDWAWEEMPDGIPKPSEFPTVTVAPDRCLVDLDPQDDPIDSGAPPASRQTEPSSAPSSWTPTVPILRWVARWSGLAADAGVDFVPSSNDGINEHPLSREEREAKALLTSMWKMRDFAISAELTRALQRCAASDTTRRQRKPARMAMLMHAPHLPIILAARTLAREAARGLPCSSSGPYIGRAAHALCKDRLYALSMYYGLVLIDRTGVLTSPIRTWTPEGGGVPSAAEVTAFRASGASLSDVMLERARALWGESEQVPASLPVCMSKASVRTRNPNPEPRTPQPESARRRVRGFFFPPSPRLCHTPHPLHSTPGAPSPDGPRGREQVSPPLEIQVCWSGGIDSTALLCSMLAAADEAPTRSRRARLVLRLDASSVREYPLFFSQHIQGAAQLEPRTPSPESRTPAPDIHRRTLALRPRMLNPEACMLNLNLNLNPEPCMSRCGAACGTHRRARHRHNLAASGAHDRHWGARRPALWVRPHAGGLLRPRSPARARPT